MLKVEQRMDIKELKTEGHSIREICRITGHSRNTVRKVLRGAHTGEMNKHERSSKLDPFKEYLRERLKVCNLSAVRLMEEITPMDYVGSISTLRRFIKEIKGRQRAAKKLTVRFETPPGKQAQADWTYCGKHETPNGKKISLYAFVMVLSYSRMLFVHFTTSMRMGELLRCHQLAFEYFGGWPQTILYDNMKQVKISANQWNEQFLDFADHYGFTPKTHRPYRPRTKGKVERGVDYVKDNFLNGRIFENVDEVNACAPHWLDRTANVRIHGTTGKRPVDLFIKEIDALTPLASMPVYNFIDPVKRTVSWESMIHFQGSRYSVPPEHAGRVVEVAAEGGNILVRADGAIIVEHRQAQRPGQCIVDKEHVSELWKLSASQAPPPDSNAKQCVLTFQQTVQRAPLALYEEVCQ